MSQQVQRVKVWGNLLTEVVRTNACVSCGACAAVCPVLSIAFVEDKPTLASVCIGCGMCYSNCPRAGFDDSAVEQTVFGRNRTSKENYLGIYQSIYSGRSKDRQVLSKCQDGGMATSLLIAFLNAHAGSRAVVSSLEQGTWHPIPRVATSRDEVLAAAGSKYTPSPSIEGVRSASLEYRRDSSWVGEIALVGTPCQMRAMRKMQVSEYSPTRLLENERLSVGLFCFETFDYKSLKTYLEGRKIDLKGITRMEIKGGRFRVFRESEVVHDVAISKLDDIVRPCCLSCTDFTAEFSDISLGSAGSPDGMNTIIVRTEKGKQILDAAIEQGLVEIRPMADTEPGISEIARLARMKKNRAKKGTSTD